jgi:hypothetical protein
LPDDWETHGYSKQIMEHIVKLKGGENDNKENAVRRRTSRRRMVRS